VPTLCVKVVITLRVMVSVHCLQWDSQTKLPAEEERYWSVHCSLHVAVMRIARFSTGRGASGRAFPRGAWERGHPCSVSAAELCSIWGCRLGDRQSIHWQVGKPAPPRGEIFDANDRRPDLLPGRDGRSGCR